MDIELLKTFLEVEKTRHFGHAANNLYLTQSAVSARIRLLEETLGVALFTRHRNNIQLTMRGERLLKHAQTILKAWKQARQDLTDENQYVLLKIGGTSNLWEILQQDWIHRLYQNIPHLIVHAEVESFEGLIRKLSEKVLDIGFLFEPPKTVDLIVKEIGQLKLLLVCTTPNQNTKQALRENYIFVDWGTSFLETHTELFPDLPPPNGHMALGSLALSFLLNCNGAAYLPESMCQPLLEKQRLFLVNDAPVIDYKVYATYAHQNIQRPLLETVLNYFTPITPTHSSEREATCHETSNTN
jgi:DNA-binding transcriptional LysR family regulator